MNPHLHFHLNLPSLFDIYRARILTILRLSMLAIAAGWIGGTVSLSLMAQGGHSNPAQITIEQLEIQDARAEINRLRDEITAMGVIISDQGKDISMMHGIGFGLGLIMVVLQAAQILTNRGGNKG